MSSTKTFNGNGVLVCPVESRNAKELGARMFGSSLADVFNTPAYDCKLVGSDQKPEFAVTRLRSGPRKMEKAPPYPPDRAILICVSLTPVAIGQWRAVYNGRSVGVTRAIPFATTFIDLNCRMEMWVRGPFDFRLQTPRLSSPLFVTELDSRVSSASPLLARMPQRTY